MEKFKMRSEQPQDDKEEETSHPRIRGVDVPQNVRLEQVAAANKRLVERAEAQLEEIKGSLLDLAERIKTEAPDCVVFLDKGARLLATPIKKYLQKDGMDKKPEFLFLNDNEFKYEYLDGNQKGLREIADEEYKQFKGKKVFFVDETFSAGTGAIAIKTMMDHLDLDAKFFALSVDLTPTAIVHAPLYFRHGHIEEVPLDEHFQRLEEISRDPRFISYQNFVKTLFTKEAALLYVVDSDRVPGVEDKKVSTLPRYSTDFLPGERPSRVANEEYDNKFREMNMKTIHKLKDMIYEALVDEANKQKDQKHKAG